MRRFLFEIIIDTPEQADAAIHDLAAIIHSNLEGVSQSREFSYLSGASIKLVEYGFSLASKARPSAPA